MEDCGFFDGPAKYGQVEFNRYFDAFLRSGIRIDENGSMGLKVTLSSNPGRIIISPGFAIINGFYYNNSSDLEMEVAQSIDRFSRYARIVVRLNIAEKNVSAAIKYGSYSYSPNVPDLQRDENIFELSLANMYVPPNGEALHYPTDERFDQTLCGSIRPKGMTEYADMISEDQRIWKAWFASIQGVSPRDYYIQAEAPEGQVAGRVWHKIY